MKISFIYKAISFICILLLCNSHLLIAQCALCTKTAQQLGDGPASGLNSGIIYLMIIPLAILFLIGFKWYKREKLNNQQQAD